MPSMVLPQGEVITKAQAVLAHSSAPSLTLRSSARIVRSLSVSTILPPA